MDEEIKSARRWERLIQGLEAFLLAVLGGAVNAIALTVMDSKDFDPFTSEGQHRLLRAAFVGGIIPAAAYFKSKHRDPDAHSDRRDD